MAKITYTEPKSYFNADMLKAARDWEKKNSAEKTKSSPKSPKKGK